MRLNEAEIRAIKESVERVFGKSAEVRLFGSRVDDSRRGGDIDLYIKSEEATATYENKIRFLVELEKRIGEQKIDVVMAKDAGREIEQTALSNGIVL